MANKSTIYSVDLDISESTRAKQTIAQMQAAFDGTQKSLDAVEKIINQCIDDTEDLRDIQKEYDKQVKQLLKDKDKEIDKLIREQAALAKNTEITEEQRKEKYDALQAQIKSLDKEKEQIKVKSKTLKLSIQEQKAQKALKNTLIEDLKLEKERLKTQFKFLDALKKVEDKYKAIKKAAADTVGKGAKIALKGGAIAGGALTAVGGLAVASAGQIAAKETALKSLRAGLDPDAVEQVYIKTGADYSTIIEAINKLSNKAKGPELINLAALEVQNPGLANLILGSKDLNANAEQLKTALIQIRKQTGIQDISAALESASKARAVTQGTVSQIEYVQAYSALQQANVTPEKIDYILRNAAIKGGDFLENVANTDFKKYARGQQLAQIKNMLPALSKLDLSQVQSQTAAEKIQEGLNKSQLTREKLMQKLLPLITSTLEKLDQAGFFDKLGDLMTGTMEFLEEATKNGFWETLKRLLDDLGEKFKTSFKTSFIDFYTDEETGSYAGRLYKRLTGGAAGGAKAQGGIINAPALVGEDGPELVLPLGYEKAGRASNIINNYTSNNSFNMSGNQQTPLAFAAALSNHKFIRTAGSI